MLAGAAKMAADVKWCSSCEKSAGRKSRVRLMQINLEEAAILCENHQCVSNSTSKILARGISKLGSLKRKRHRQSLTSPPGALQASPIPQSPIESSQDHLANAIPGSTNSGTVPSLPLRTRPWEGKVLQWQNKDALCWLDVSMCALVHCVSLRSCLRHQREDSLLKELCREFDRAQMAGQMDSTTGRNLEQFHQRTDHDRLRDGQNGSCVKKEDQCKGGGGQAMTTSTEATSNGLSDTESMQYNLQSNLSNLNTEAALDWLVTSNDEITKRQELLTASKSNKKQPQVLSTNGTNPSAKDARGILETIRQKLWKALEPKLGCKLGSEETPVFALPLLARLSGAVEEHFLARYRWELYCKACHHTEVKLCKKAMVSLTTLAADFTMSCPSIIRACPACQIPGQTSRMTYHSLPACMMFHFSEGVHNPDVMSYNMKHESSSYEISSIIQYTSNPNHFIVWIRDIQRNLWLKCNDLEASVCEWQLQPPIIPASEIHVIMIERQGEPCGECEAITTEMTKISSNINQVTEKLMSVNTLSGRTPTDTQNAQHSSVTSVSTGLWKKTMPTFHSYSQRSKDLNLNHLTVIDLDTNAEENETLVGTEGHRGMTDRGANTNGAERQESWSRSSSPRTVSSTRAKKRSLPNYLLNTSHKPSIKSKNEHRNDTHKKALSNNTSNQGNVCKVQDCTNSGDVTSTNFGGSNVYTKRIRPNGRILQGGMYFPRKPLYPSYSETQTQQNGDDRPLPFLTLPTRLPEGPFVRCSVWKRRGDKPIESDTSNFNSPSDLTLSSKSLAMAKRPRCDSLSSVSSPSACSDLSSFSDNMSISSGKDELTSTIDELYKVLDISGEKTRLNSRIPSFILDDDFLADILADDPLPAALPCATGYSVIERVKRSEPTVDKTALVTYNQELDCIVPSIEPMGQELLAKLVS